MLNVVFDTVVFVRSLINPYSRWGEAVFRSSDRYRLFFSQPVLEEILEVLHRPELTRKFRTLQGLDRSTVLLLLDQAELVDIPEIEPISRDPKDDKFLVTAREARADYLVTEDEDLLVLKEYEGVKIINTETFLSVLEQEEDK